MEVFDYSNNSTNKYKVEARHNLIRPCFVCGKGSEIIFDGTDYFKYFVLGQGYVQNVFPYLSPEQRDHILSGIHPNCQ